MPDRPVIKVVDNPTTVGGPSPPSQAVERKPGKPAASAPRPPEAPEAGETLVSETKPQPGTVAHTNPYSGIRKVRAPVRLFPPLWDRLEELVRELQVEGHEVDKTALLNAMLHFNGPTDLSEARDLTNRWRALLALPPKRT